MSISPDAAYGAGLSRRWPLPLRCDEWPCSCGRFS